MGKAIFNTIFIIGLLCFKLGAQNLVRNTSFEEMPNSDRLFCAYYTSPITSMKDKLYGWDNAGNGTSDIISLLVDPGCATYAYPNKNKSNEVGEQLPHTGKVMCGFYAYTDDKRSYREYLQNKLITELIPDQKYHISLFVSLADYSQNATDKIGIYFSMDSLDRNDFLGYEEYLFPLKPQVEFNTLVDDDLGWTELSADFVADKSYSYMTIGTFANDSDLTIVSHKSPIGFRKLYGSFYFIDDVSVEPVCEKAPPVSLNTCYNNSIELDASAVTSFKGWSDSTNSKIIVTKKTKFEVNPLVNKTYFLNYRECDIIPYQVNVLGNLSVNLGKDVGIYPGQKIILDAKNPGAHYQWQDGSDKRTLEVTQDGKYWVTVSDGYGCSKSDTINIVDITLEMPNVFTPNGDDKNEHFVPIKMSGIVSSEMVIYNRWGKQVFKTSDLASGWDGDSAESGVYYWSLNYTDFNGKESFVKGLVSLLR